MRSGLLTVFGMFLVLGGIVLIAQLLLQRARFGRIVPGRLVWTSVVLCYACVVTVVVFLPVPGPYTRPPTQTIQLMPFHWIADALRAAPGESPFGALTTTAFRQMAQNMLLFVPFGIFARLLWRRGVVGAVTLGFACSLFIELTQLTANWGTAPFQYRIFDVDDLITNTTGALFGWIAGALYVALRSPVGAQPTGGEGVRFTEAREAGGALCGGPSRGPAVLERHRERGGREEQHD